MREIIQETSMNDFWTLWKPDDLIVASRKIVRDELQKKLYALQKTNSQRYLYRCVIAQEILDNKILMLRFLV